MLVGDQSIPRVKWGVVWCCGVVLGGEKMGYWVGCVDASFTLEGIGCHCVVGVMACCGDITGWNVIGCIGVVGMMVCRGVLGVECI